MREIHCLKRHGSGGTGKSTQGAWLLLAPLNVLCVLVAALAVIGISSMARNAGAAIPDGEQTKPPQVTEEVTLPVGAEPVTDPVDTSA